ncbi:MAG: ABC transporter permease subunit [Gammaproteobacteria bacterium]|nr:ABC transporter permease subunit [Gammaproteobacteria bacterium]
MNNPTTSTELATLPRRRRWVNAITQRVVGLGGAAVIGAIALIFFYLVWVVAPILAGASIDDGPSYPLQAGEPLLIEASENGEVGVHVAASGVATFFDLADGSEMRSLRLGATELRRVKTVYPHNTVYAVQNVVGELALYESSFPVSFKGGERTVLPELEPVFAEQWLELGETDDFDVYYQDFQVIVASLAGKQLTLTHYRDAEPGYELEFPRSRTIELDRGYQRVLIGPRGTWAYLIGTDGTVEIFDIKRPTSPQQVYLGKVVAEGTTMTALEPLLGRYSLLVADDAGRIAQWFLVRGEFGYALEKAREFQLDKPALKLIAEPRRKGFAAIDAENRFSLFYSTSARSLDQHVLAEGSFLAAAIAPRSDLLLTASSTGKVNTYHLENEHPEVSWSALWSRIWYEGYPEPVYSWQSSSADNDFEPKFSLTPLLFGTLKAAFYAMVFAAPLAIMGALYTAYFMAPRMRRIVKPGIEIMAALPTVILGFLAGLWLAPLIEANLAGVISILLALPIGIVITAVLWSRLPDKVTARFEGWYGLLILPVIVLTVVAGFALGPVLETTFFGGDSRAWFLEVLGLEYDQRNALVVGLAMGLAVIPTIFSIAEDAIYGVPTHLINGSLALGATPWQTLIRVVVLTASPGIFSAVMIGLGRAVGETMIVLMATGNTPIMDLNIFQGMRTFAANIAVELPESEVDSTHYRILFLAALVLFLITFIFNTAAELVRQRLRARYGNL